jgi:hypothetical protein
MTVAQLKNGNEIIKNIEYLKEQKKAFDYSRDSTEQNIYIRAANRPKGENFKECFSSNLKPLIAVGDIHEMARIMILSRINEKIASLEKELSEL